MMTLRQFAAGVKAIPVATMWYLEELAEARGKQELFTRQSPQKLKVLREHAVVESAVSSNRIEGVEVDPARVRTVVLGRRALQDRQEEEVRGYRDALKIIHEQRKKLSISQKTVAGLHRRIRGDDWDAGRYKDKTSDIIEHLADGRTRVRFTTVSPAKTPAFMKQLIQLWRACGKEQWISPLIALAAFNLDFLCIHPFRDGNGRVSRLLLLLQCYHLGYEVGRYISLERLIEENKDRYYETLQGSSRGWHQGRHDPWPYVNYLMYILRAAYREFEDRLERTESRRGEKTESVKAAIRRAPDLFRMADIQQACPAVSIDLIRRVMKDLRGKSLVQCLGRGQAARWRKTGKGRIR